MYHVGMHRAGAACYQISVYADPSHSTSLLPLLKESRFPSMCCLAHQAAVEACSYIDEALAIAERQDIYISAKRQAIHVSECECKLFAPNLLTFTCWRRLWV